MAVGLSIWKMRNHDSRYKGEVGILIKHEKPWQWIYEVGISIWDVHIDSKRSRQKSVWMKKCACKLVKHGWTVCIWIDRHHTSIKGEDKHI